MLLLHVSSQMLTHFLCLKQTVCAARVASVDHSQVSGALKVYSRQHSLGNICRNFYEAACILSCCCRQEIEQLMEAANWAPTHGRTEPWRFVVIGPEAFTEMLHVTDQVRRLHSGSDMLALHCWRACSGEASMHAASDSR